MDHDQRFKALVREFFPEFMDLFFPEWARCFDLATPVWLEQELLPDPPEGERHPLDLVAKLHATESLADGMGGDPDEWLALVMIEIEAPDRTTLLKPRLPRYYVHLRERHELPVLPIVLYLNVGLDGIGTDEVVERIGDFPVLTFRYLYVGLPSLDAVQYARGENLLGVSLSALMNAPEAEWPPLADAAIERLERSPLNELRRFLLSECFQAYVPLDEAGRKVLKEKIMIQRANVLKPRNKTIFDEQMEEAEATGARNIAVALLESRFQSLPTYAVAKLAAMNAAQLREMALRAVGAKSLAELFPDETQTA